LTEDRKRVVTEQRLGFVPAVCPDGTSNLSLKGTHATGGLILLDRHGNPGFAFNTARMAYGFVASDGSFLTAV